MFAHPSVLPISSRQRWAPTGSVARLRKPLATLLLLVLLTQSAGPVFAASASPPPSSGQGQTAATPVSGSSASVPGAAPAAPGKGEAPEGASSLLAGGPEGGTSPLTTFGVEAFQTDLSTGAATAEIPIVVPPGTAGVAPKVALRYHSGTVDDLRGTPTSDGLPPDQAQWTGLGWTLDIGGFIFRDTKGTVDPGDDTFKLGFGGAGHATEDAAMEGKSEEVFQE